jgi:hypothetical protein
MRQGQNRAMHVATPRSGRDEPQSWRSDLAESTRTPTRRLAAWRTHRRELILTFHGLGAPPKAIGQSERRVWVPVEWFEAIVDASLESGVLIALDDGNASDVEYALPALRERGVAARFFPPTGRIGVSGYLTADDLAEIRDAGMQIGSQGVRHRPWRTIDTRDLLDELESSRRTLSDVLGQDVTEAALPFGSYDRRVLHATRTAGYERVFNSDGGAAQVGSWLSPRTTVSQDKPLEHWLALATRGAHRGPGPLMRGKLLVKRLR